MQRLSVALPRCRFVGQTLMQAGSADQCEGVARAHVSTKRRVEGLLGSVHLAFCQIIAALRLALDVKTCRNDIADAAGKLKQLGRVAVLELELDLGNGTGRPGPRDNVALIESDHDVRAVAVYV